MRMWMVPPQIMCRQHLLGEHVELHMFVGSIKKGTSLNGYIKNGLVETHNIKSRHKKLVREMKSRGMKHSSPLKYKDVLHLGKVKKKKSRKALTSRCPECKRRYKEYKRALHEVKG